MTDPEVLLGWLIAAYLAVACVVAVVASRTGFDIPAAARSTWGRIVPARSTGMRAATTAGRAAPGVGARSKRGCIGSSPCSARRPSTA